MLRFHWNSIFLTSFCLRKHLLIVRIVRIYLESLSLIKNYTKFERKYERRLIFNVSIWICLKKKKSIKNLFNVFVEKEKLISNFERGYLT